MRIGFILFLFYQTASMAQTHRWDYIINIGKYSFLPAFVDDGSPGTKFSPIDSNEPEEYIIYFPERKDTIESFDAQGNPEKTIFTSSHYSINRFIDSISNTYADTLLKSEIHTLFKKQEQTVKKLYFEIIYPNGQKFKYSTSSATLHNPEKLPVQHLPYYFVVILRIEFADKTGKYFSITDNIGWKIKNIN